MASGLIALTSCEKISELLVGSIVRDASIRLWIGRQKAESHNINVATPVKRLRHEVGGPENTRQKCTQADKLEHVLQNDRQCHVDTIIICSFTFLGTVGDSFEVD